MSERARDTGLLDEAADRVEERLSHAMGHQLSPREASDMIAASVAGSPVDGRELNARLLLDLLEWRELVEGVQSVEELEAVLRGFLLRQFLLGYTARELAE